MKNDVVFTLHLFAGAGGGILADTLLGHLPIGAIEIDPYARKVLLSRQADKSLPVFPIWDDVQTFTTGNADTKCFIERCREFRDFLCISGGFPCQDISCAGKMAGINGEKSRLWKEFARIIRDIRPRYAFLENSPMLICNGIDVVINDLSQMGYALAWGVVSAKDGGAPHLRKRFGGVAKREVSDPKSSRWKTMCNNGNVKPEFPGFEKLCISIPNSSCNRDGGNESRQEMEKDSLSNPLYNRDARVFGEPAQNNENGFSQCGGKAVNVRGEWWNAQPRLDGMVDGLSTWVDENQRGDLWGEDEKGIPRTKAGVKNKTNRLKCIGNAQVPLQAAFAFTVLKDAIDQYV